MHDCGGKKTASDKLRVFSLLLCSHLLHAVRWAISRLFRANESRLELARRFPAWLARGLVECVTTHRNPSRASSPHNLRLPSVDGPHDGCLPPPPCAVPGCRVAAVPSLLLMAPAVAWLWQRAWILFPLLLGCVAPATAGRVQPGSERFFDPPSEVIVLKTRSDWSKLEKSNFAWVVAFYRESCGFCALLRPEWEEAATSLKRYVRIAAVDVERSRELTGYAQQRYNFQVEGVPTIKTFVPLVKKQGRPLIDTYNGERKANAVVSHVRGLMPSFLLPSKLLKFDESLHISNLETGPVALFFSEKPSPSATAKALSSKFRGRLRIGQLRVGTGRQDVQELAHRCAATNSVTITDVKLCVMYIGHQANQQGDLPVHIVANYGRKLSIMSLENFLMDYVPKSKGGLGKGERFMKKLKSADHEQPQPADSTAEDDRDL